MTQAAYTLTPTGLTLTIKARPGIARARAPRLIDVGEGRAALEVTIAAPPEDGRANQALIEALASFFGVKQRAVTLKSGASGKLKIFEIVGDGRSLATLLTKL